MNRIYEKYVERGGRPCFHLENIEPYIQILNELYQLASSMDYIRDIRIFDKLTSILTLLMEQSWNSEPISISSPKKQDLQNIKDYLDEHFSEKLTLD